MTADRNLYPFTQGSLEWPLGELFSSDLPLWNQCKYIAFNNFSCRILIISHKMLIVTETTNEKTNELIIYAILCRNVTIIYWQKLASLFQMQEILKACRNSKWNFSRRCFIADVSQIKTVWLHVVIFSELDILHFPENVYLLKYYPEKVSRNCFYSFNCSIQTGMQVSEFSLPINK